MNSPAPLESDASIEAPSPAAAPAGRSALLAGIHGMVVATSVGQVLPVLMTTLTSELHLTVTQAGRDLVQLVRLRREAWLAQRLQELTPEERATLLAAAPILEKLSQS